MNLVRLERHQHPSPPRRELRRRGVYASTGRYLGHVAHLYVDEERKPRFVDVVTGGFLGLGRKHHLVPVEAITEETLNAITLGVDEETVWGAPRVLNPLAAPTDEGATCPLRTLRLPLHNKLGRPPRGWRRTASRGGEDGLPRIHLLRLYEKGMLGGSSLL